MRTRLPVLVLCSALLVGACSPQPAPEPEAATLSTEDQAACDEYVPLADERTADGDAIEDAYANGEALEDGALAERNASGLELDALALRLADSGVSERLEERLREVAYLRPRETVSSGARYYIALDAIKELCRS